MTVVLIRSKFFNRAVINVTMVTVLKLEYYNCTCGSSFESAFLPTQRQSHYFQRGPCNLSKILVGGLKLFSDKLVEGTNVLGPIANYMYLSFWQVPTESTW